MRIENPVCYSDKPITGNKVGSWRFVEPYLSDKKPPCQIECPLEHSIREVFDLIQKNSRKEAFLTMADKNPFLSMTGSVCPHFCEGGCSRKEVDESLMISDTEASLGKMFIDEPLDVLSKKQKFTFKTAVIGGGPSGLAAAFHLARRGIAVDLFEKEDKLGGMPWFGIPDYRLDKNLYFKEIERVLKTFPNIQVFLNHEITQKDIESFQKKYDAVFIGAGKQQAVEFPDKKVIKGFEFLKNYHKGTAHFPQNGTYLVLGGGNTAMDIAGYLLRNGNQVRIIVRGNKLRAFEKEVSEVIEKGGLVFYKTEFEKWENKKVFLKSEGHATSFEADGIFACFGQEAENVFKNIAENDKVYFIGDLESENATVVHAVASAKKVTEAYLSKKFLFKKNRRQTIGTTR